MTDEEVKLASAVGRTMGLRRGDVLTNADLAAMSTVRIALADALRELAAREAGGAA